MSKPAAAAKQEKTPAAKAPPEKEESDEEEEENKSSKEETNDATTTPSQSTSPSVTISSIQQHPSLPTVPSTPTLNNSPAAPPPTVIASAPEESITPATTPKPAVFRPPPPIITAEENEHQEPSTTGKSGKKAADQDSKVSSLKLFKNTSGRPEESVFETKHPNLHAVDKGYLQKLIETKEKYDKLEKIHPKKCVLEYQQKARLKKIERREKEKYKKERAEEDAKEKKRKRDWRREHRGQVMRDDEIRGSCWQDSLDDDERYGPLDPMKHTLKRMETMNPKLLNHCQKVIEKEMKEANIPFQLNSWQIYPIKFIEVQGQRWLAVCPMWGRIQLFCSQTRIYVINLTQRLLEVSVRLSGQEDNFKLSKMEVMNPMSINELTITFLNKHPMRKLEEALTFYFNDRIDLNHMRHEFGRENIDLSRHYAGLIVVGVFVHNWKGLFEQGPREMEKDVVKAAKRAQKYLKEAKLYRQLPPKPKEISIEEELKNFGIKLEKQKVEDDSSKSEKEKEKEMEKEKRKKEKEKKKPERKQSSSGNENDEKVSASVSRETSKDHGKASVSRETSKDRVKRSGIKANNKTSVDIDDKVSASVSRETSKDRGKGTGMKDGKKKDKKYSEEKPSPSVSRDVEDGKARKL